jgi:hypothetical protein
VQSNGLTNAAANGSQERSPFNADQLLEVIASPWPGEEVEYHRLFMFDRLQRGEHNWNFLIVTRKQGDERVELAAVAFELDDSGKVSTRLESRKASIPAGRLSEVIEGLLLRFDETGGDYTDYDLSGMAGSGAPAPFLAGLTGIPAAEVSEASDESTAGLQQGDGSPQ